MIKEFVLAGGIFYILLDGVQIIGRPSVNMQGLAVGILLLAATSVFWYREEVPLKRWEYLLVWCAVMLFVLYGALNLGGIL
jgi:uncharacterized membrane protein